MTRYSKGPVIIGDAGTTPHMVSLTNHQRFVLILTKDERNTRRASKNKEALARAPA